MTVPAYERVGGRWRFGVYSGELGGPSTRLRIGRCPCDSLPGYTMADTSSSNPRRSSETRWTHPSVRALAGSRDPVAVVTERARSIALEAIDRGWGGPPFDPIALAELLGIEVVANVAIRDARTVPVGRGRVRIEVNPDRPRGRMRYSVAHELAHTIFPDVAEKVRNRARHDELEGDEWQLEALCNIGAAELLMPLGPLNSAVPESLTIRDVLDLQRRFDVSTEALVIRLVESSDAPLAAFCASPREPGRFTAYHLDYMIPSRAWGGRLPPKLRLPKESVVRQCTAIGYSAAGVETWSPSTGPVEIEAVGIPPYPGGIVPRVVGFLKLPVPAVMEGQGGPAKIQEVLGSATEPRGEGQRIVVHVVNDKTANWGGGGFASAVRTAWPEVQRDFRDWADHHRASYRLGAVRVSRVDETTSVASLVAQHGYGPSATPRLRYAALRQGLAQVSAIARERGASVHMPRIGTGQAGGRWSIVRDIILETLIEGGVPVTVYDLPGQRPPVEPQTTLEFLTVGRPA